MSNRLKHIAPKISKAARRASDERLAAHLASDALTLSNLALAQEYRKARR